MLYKIFLYASLIIHFVASCESSENGKKLVFVQVVFSHGIHAPVESYPNDPYKHESFWPMGRGQLTNIGKMQMYALGDWLRNRYNGFLPNTYSYKDIYVQSADVDRILISADMCLVGLYPSHENDTLLEWQSIPIHTTPEEKDNMLGKERKCRRISLEKDSLIKYATFKKYTDELKTLFEYLSEHTGVKINCFYGLKELYDTLLAEASSDLPLPEWTVDVYPCKFLRSFDMLFEIKNYSLTLRRLWNGLLMNEIFTLFNKKSKDMLVPDRKMWMYSTYNTILADILTLFDEYDQYPPNAAAIIFEMWKESNEYYINVLYKNETDLKPISIMGCNQCSLKKVMNLMKPYMLTQTDLAYECNSNNILTIISLLIITVIFILFFTMVCMLVRYIVAGKMV